MGLTKIKHNAEIFIDDYPFHDSLKKEVLSLLKVCQPISQNRSNVKASLHTEWDWEPNNIQFRNVKAYIKEKIEGIFRPGARSDGPEVRQHVSNFWGNVYEKGDYAQPHSHKPHVYSFAYFVKSKWYHPPLVFGDSGWRMRPKEGRFIAFPAYLIHHVPKHRYNDTRITLSGNLDLEE